MTLIVDAAPLVALGDRRDPLRAKVRAVLESDATVVALAARFETRRLLTFDHRHFRAVVPLQGGAFELLPER